MAALPALDGVGFRMFRDSADYPALARIITAAARGEGDDRVETPQGLASGYDHLTRCDPTRDLLVAEVDGVPVGYSRVTWDDESDGRVYKFVCFLDPAHGGRGIGSALLAWNEARLREIGADHDVPVKIVQAWVGDRNQAATDLVRRAGYQPVTYMAEMVRPSVDDLPEHPLPPGLEIRPVREDDIRTIWEADVEAFKDHWGYVEQSEEDYERFRAFPYLDPTLWKIAWDDDGVAGQVKSFIDTAQNEEHGRKRGWTEAISTSRRWRRRGVAKALIVESIRELAAHGMTEVALGVHTENPNGAYQLYESLGYEIVNTWTTYRKPLSAPPLRLLGVGKELVCEHFEDSELDDLHAGSRSDVVAHRGPRRPGLRLVLGRLPERDEPGAPLVFGGQHEDAPITRVLAQPLAEVRVGDLGDRGEHLHRPLQLGHGRNHPPQG